MELIKEDAKTKLIRHYAKQIISIDECVESNQQMLTRAVAGAEYAHDYERIKLLADDSKELMIRRKLLQQFITDMEYELND